MENGKENKLSVERKKLGIRKTRKGVERGRQVDR